MGYVIAEDGEGDIMVRPVDFNKAFNGDKVRVQIKRPAFGNKKREGAIADVVSRKQIDFIGTLRGHAGRWFFLPDSDKPLPHFDLDEDPPVPVDEEGKVIVRFMSWNKNERRPTGRFIDVVKHEDMNDFAMKNILLEKGFPLSFSDEAMEDALRMSDHISEKELKKRKDFRNVLTFTIDPVDAKDFDDAISIETIKEGLYEIGVHIADVSHFVAEETVLDEEAYQRATSVYLPDRVNPMLPERISNELCSLRPNEDKYTFSAVFHITDKGAVKKTWLGRTVIHSNHRFSYEDVQEIIEKGEGIYSNEILLLNNLAQQFRKQRFKNGAINFSSQEVRFKLDENGKPLGIVIKESKEAHQLIEEFMLLANRTVAAAISKIEVKGKPLPFPYRIHDTPDEEKLLPFIALAKKFGYTFNMNDPDSIASSFNKMLNEARGTPQQHLLEQLGIRTMSKAVYTSENIGHYGLGFENYCHFTSPIRRYPDIIVHRVLQQVLDDKIVADKKMEQKCKHASERERAAMESERAANKYKQVEFMSQFLGDEFDAVITGVSSFGFWAETVEHKCEGLVGMKDLNYYDDFRLIESDYLLAGLRTGRQFRIGDVVRIKVVAANLEKRQLDYEWVLKAQKEEPLPEKFSGSVATENKPQKQIAETKPAKQNKAVKANLKGQSQQEKQKQPKKKTNKPIPETAPIPKAIKKKIKH